jgi:hypothetical protein
MARNNMIVSVGLSESDLENLIEMCEGSIKLAECCNLVFRGAVDVVAHRSVASNLQHRMRDALAELMRAEQEREAKAKADAAKKVEEKKPEPAAV